MAVITIVNNIEGIYFITYSSIEYKHTSAKFDTTGEQGVYLTEDQWACITLSRKAKAEKRQGENIH